MSEVLRDPTFYTATDERQRGDFHSQARAIVKDLFEHSARIYWTDFLLSMVLAYAAVALYLLSPTFSAAILHRSHDRCLRAVSLWRVHSRDRAHARERMPVFRAAWNILFAIPFLMPSFMYKNHADHHNPRHFGTVKDGEYLALGAGPVSRIVGYFLQVPLLPALAIFRFLVLTPLSFMHPRLRRWVLAHASSFVINPKYRRSVAARRTARNLDRSRAGHFPGARRVRRPVDIRKSGLEHFCQVVRSGHGGIGSELDPHPGRSRLPQHGRRDELPRADRGLQHRSWAPRG